MTKAIRVRAHGGPEVLSYEDVEVAEPGPGQAKLRQTAIGLNFIDVYYRTGLYAAPGGLPFIPGAEGAGVVTSVGEGVTEVLVGDRVAYFGGVGAYAEERLMPADRLVKIPADLSDEIAAAMMLKGLTAWYLLHVTFPIAPGTVLLCHAAAGGVGLILGQWARSHGAVTIGTAGSDEKCALAAANGYDHVINYKEQDFVAEVARITDGAKCDVVYDSVGLDTFLKSLDCLKPLGMMVSFGQSSGAVPPLNVGLLAQKGSLFLTRPTLFNYAASRADLKLGADTLFDAVIRDKVKIGINQRYALADARKAHEDLEGRRTTGATVLLA